MTEIRQYVRYNKGKNSGNILMVWSLLGCNERVFTWKNTRLPSSGILDRIADACRYGDLALVKHWISRCDRRSFMEWHHYFVSVAYDNGHSHIVEYLFKQSPPTIDYWMNLYNACVYGSIRFVKYFVQCHGMCARIAKSDCHSRVVNFLRKNDVKYRRSISLY